MPKSTKSWSERRVLLTGGGGFLGTHLRLALEDRRPSLLLAPRRDELDLRDRRAVDAYLDRHRPDTILHAAAAVGGIGANRAEPARFFYENAIMGIELIDAAQRIGVDKFICLGTTCAYPKFTPEPFHEDDLWNGFPEETNAPYGIAKRGLLVQLQAYRAQWGMNGIFLLPSNLYGPGDHFDLERGHVIPTLLMKFLGALDAGRDEVVLWGDGSASRDFLYVEDAVAGILAAAERYDAPEPMNIGSGASVTIAELAGLVSAMSGFTGRIVWDTSKPNGQPRRRLDITRARQILGFEPAVSLEDGLRRTFEWYRRERAAKT